MVGFTTNTTASGTFPRPTNDVGALRPLYTAEIEIEEVWRKTVFTGPATTRDEWLYQIRIPGSGPVYVLIGMSARNPDPIDQGAPGSADSQVLDAFVQISNVIARRWNMTTPGAVDFPADNVPTVKPTDPAHGVTKFYRNRLIYAYRDEVWFSRIGDPTDWDYTPGEEGNLTVSDDDPIRLVLPDEEGLHQIHIGQRVLFFGDEKTFVLNDGPISPTTSALSEAMSLGMKRGTRATELRGVVVFIEANGELLRALDFAEARQGFIAPILAPHGSHLLDDVIHIERAIGLRGVDGTERIFCNTRSGRIIVLTYQVESGMAAFSDWAMIDADGALIGRLAGMRVAGSVLSCQVTPLDTDGEDLDPIQCEFDADCMTDLCATGTGGAPVLFDEHPAGRPFQVVWGGDLSTPRIVADAIPTEALDADVPWETGLPIQWLLKTTPWVQRTTTGSALGLRQARIVEVVTEFLGSRRNMPNSYVVNGRTSIFGARQPFGQRPGTVNVPLLGNPELQVVSDRQLSIFGWRGLSAVELRGTERATLAGINMRISTG